jgi:4-amino-4-deoxy-L-arabinose transferase-like glycosyltransferase
MTAVIEPADVVEPVEPAEPDTSAEHGEPGGPSAAPNRWLALAYGRLPLIAIMALQVILAYQLSNTAFEDESLYLYAGHREVALLLHGTPTYDTYPSYFSGAPFLYPVVVAWFDTMWGLEGARAFSLVMMLATTGLVWTVTRRLYGPAAAVFAAAVFATSAPTLFLSRFATYDAMTIFLLAVALWIVVRTAKAPIISVLLAAPVLALAVAVKYAALLYVPSIIAVAVLAVPVSRGSVTGSVRLLWIRAASRGAALGAAVFAFLAVALASVSQDMRTGITSTTTNRDLGSDPFSAIFQLSVVWCGWVFVLAVAGACFEWLRRKRRGAQRGARTSLAAVLAGSALLATAYQAHIQKMQSLHKHLGFGLMLAAPAAGLGIAALSRMGSRDVRKRIPGLAMGICVVLAFYAGHAVRPLYYGWPDSAAMVDTLRPLVHDGNERYLAEENEVPRYYLRDKTEPSEWFTTFFFQYTLKNGQSVSGLPAYQAAIADRYFNLVVLDHGPTAALDVDLDKALKSSGAYTLIASVPGATAHGPQTYEIWQATKA